MEYTTELFSLVIFFYIGVGVFGYHLGKILNRISDKLDAIDDSIRDGIDKLDAIELKLQGGI